MAQNQNKSLRSFKVTHVANILDCSLPTVYRLINTKKLKSFKIGGDQRVTEEEILRLQSGEAAA